MLCIFVQFLFNLKGESEANPFYNSSEMAKYQLSENLKSSLVDLPEVLVFIEKLQKAIGRLKRRLKKISSKRKKIVDSCTQTDHPQEQPQSIVEEIAEAAEQAVIKMGMVYEKSSGLYYDYKTGYYYNAEYGLYYDGTTGTYMTYDAASDTYNFYSKVDAPSETMRKKGGDGDRDRDLERRPSRRRKRDKDVDSWNVNGINQLRVNTRERSRIRREKYARRSKECHDATTVDLEEGECSDDEDALVIALSENECVDSESSEAKNSDGGADDITKKYPPCIRVVVEESNITSVRKGSLFMVPYTGGTLGREGTSHAIILPDINVSKHHLQFRYDEERKRYLVCDLGSRNGTLLNGNRMAPSMQESDPMELVHGSKLQVGSTILLCHIHIGAQTCGHCEPGLLQDEDDVDISSSHSIAPSKSEQHKQELKQLRKKFGISQYEMGKVDPGPGYTNRAQTRRDTVGSSNPHEKTQVASLTECIPAQNKGFKMLAKMGWTEGTSLGKDGTGRVEPVELVSNAGTSGIGSSSNSIGAVVDNHSKMSTESADCSNQTKPTTTIRWLKTKERYDKLSNITVIRDKLNDADDSSS